MFVKINVEEKTEIRFFDFKEKLKRKQFQYVNYYVKNKMFLELKQEVSNKENNNTKSIGNELR